MNNPNNVIEKKEFSIKIKKSKIVANVLANIVTKVVANVVTKVQEIIHNRGTGAGGANTNHNGKLFEKKTCNEQRLLDRGFSKTEFSDEIDSKKNTVYYYYLSKTFEDKTVVFVSQKAFRKYMKQKFNLEMIRDPDEAYIIEYNNGRKVVKILEKKKQSRGGSVEDKLWNGPSYKSEYEYVLGEKDDKFEVCYAYCVSKYLQDKFSTIKKFKILKNGDYKKYNIGLLFGDDENYVETLDEWINNSL